MVFKGVAKAAAVVLIDGVSTLSAIIRRGTLHGFFPVLHISCLISCIFQCC